MDKEFTDQLFGLRKRAASGAHEFDRLCTGLGIEHRLTPPKSPQTNGMVERFNGRIEDVLQSHHFHSGEDLETRLHRYVWLYNQQLPQSALGSKTPLQAIKNWYRRKPELFRKRPHNLPGCDSYAPKINRIERRSDSIGSALYRLGSRPLSETLLSGPRHAPASGNAPEQLVVFLHGRGANGDDLIGLAPVMAQHLPDAMFLSPDAPLPVDGFSSGLQWFDSGNRDPEYMVAGVRAAAPAINAFLDHHLAENDLKDENLAIFGFSQGYRMALQCRPAASTLPGRRARFFGFVVRAGVARR